MPISRPPWTLRATRMPMARRPTTNTRVGTEVMEPPSPSWTGGPPAVGRTKPESTKPMKAMNRPMPTVMAALSSLGTARKMAVRAPVTPNRTIRMPLITTRPMASAQVTSWITETARNELMPRPAARPNGRLAMRPKRMVMTPAVRPVTAPTCAAESQPPGHVGGGVVRAEAAQDQGVQDDDVRHGEEGDQAAAEFAGQRWSRAG